MDRKEQKMLDALKNLSSEYAEEVEEAATVIAENIFKHKASPKEAFAISDRKMEGMYAQGYQLYNAGNYKKAYQAFELLTTLDPYDPRYLFGMAGCLHMLKDYHTALQLYAQAAAQDHDNPVPYYHAADCAIQLKDSITAIVMLHLCVEKSEEKPEFSFIKDRALILKENLVKEVNENAAKKQQQEVKQGGGGSDG